MAAALLPVAGVSMAAGPTADPAEPEPPVDALDQWPQWRGPLATGEAPRADPPVRWSERSNVRWKVELPGKGHSTPVVWGDGLFLTTAVPVGEPLEPSYADADGAHDNAPITHRHDFVVLKVDRATGEIVWRRTVRSEVPWEGMHRSGSYASASPATDGEVLVAPFGSHGIYGLDLDGKVLWEKDLGDMNVKHAHGEGAGPVLSGDFVVLAWDHEGPSFLVALDRLTGEERWRVKRTQGTSWSTPIVVEHDGKRQVVVAGTDVLRGHDLETGEEIWRVGGLSANVVASPVSADGLVYAGSSYEHQVFFAVRLDGARGDLTVTDHVVWQRTRGTPYVPSPLLYEGALYFHNHYQSVLTRVDAADGREVPGPMRLPGIRNVYGSPVAAAGRVYITDLHGTTVVLRDGDTPEVLAVNRLDDGFSASAALAGDDLYLRGERYLYALSDRADADQADASDAD